MVQSARTAATRPGCSKHSAVLAGGRCNPGNGPAPPRLSTYITLSFRDRHRQGSEPLRWQASAPAQASLQAGANHSQQLFVVGRLLEKSDGAGFERTFFVDLRIASRKHNHRDDRKRRILLQVFQHRKSVARRQTEIENDEVGTFLLSQSNGGITVTSIHGIEVVGP